MKPAKKQATVFVVRELEDPVPLTSAESVLNFSKFGLSAMPRLDRHRRVALFVTTCEESNYAAWIGFDAQGPQLYVGPLDKFQQKYSVVVPGLTTEEVALSLLAQCQSAYLPGNGVREILVRVYIMNNAGDLKTKSGKELLELYNKLATAAGRPTVKEFSDKASAIKRISALQEAIKLPTATQTANAAAVAGKTAAKKPAKAKPLSRDEAAMAKQGLKVVKPSITEMKGKADKADKTAAKKPAAKGEKKAGGTKPQGIGAYATELILAGKTNEETLNAVLKKFPGASTSASSVAWYRNKLKSDGLLK